MEGIHRYAVAGGARVSLCTIFPLFPLSGVINIVDAQPRKSDTSLSLAPESFADTTALLALTLLLARLALEALP